MAKPKRAPAPPKLVHKHCMYDGTTLEAFVGETLQCAACKTFYYFDLDEPLVQYGFGYAVPADGVFRVVQPGEVVCPGHTLEISQARGRQIAEERNCFNCFEVFRWTRGKSPSEETCPDCLEELSA